MKTYKTDIRVRYKETDRMGVVYYGNYLTWFEVARNELFRDAGLSYREMEEKLGVRFMVASASCNYKSSVTYDDLVTVETQICKIKNTSFGFNYKVQCGTRLVAHGETLHVFTDKTGKPIRIPEKVRQVLLR